MKNKWKVVLLIVVIIASVGILSVIIHSEFAKYGDCFGRTGEYSKF